MLSINTMPHSIEQHSFQKLLFWICFLCCPANEFFCDRVYDNLVALYFAHRGTSLNNCFISASEWFLQASIFIYIKSKSTPAPGSSVWNVHKFVSSKHINNMMLIRNAVKRHLMLYGKSFYFSSKIFDTKILKNKKKALYHSAILCLVGLSSTGAAGSRI